MSGIILYSISARALMTCTGTVILCYRSKAVAIPQWFRTSENFHTVRHNLQTNIARHSDT